MIYTVYRGEHGDFDTIQTQLPSITFSNSKEVAEAYSKLGDYPKIYCAIIEINNLFFDRDDSYVDFIDDIVPIFGLDKSIQIAVKYADYITNTNNWEEQYSEDYGNNVEQLLLDDPEAIYNLSMLIWPLLDDPELIDILKSKGYDGAIYGGFGSIRPDTLDDIEYRIFYPTQIQSYYKC
jgi:hypothetical protein